MRLRSVLAVSAGLSIAGSGWLAPVAVAAPADEFVLRSGELSVAVAKDFPRVLRYRDNASGAELGGSARAPGKVVLNGKEYEVGVSAESTGASASYKLTFPELAGVELDASLSVVGRVTTFRVDAVRDTEAFRVGTIDVPGHDLVSVSSDQDGASTAFTRLDTNSTRTADRFAKVTGDTPADAKPVGAAYGIVNTGKLAAAVESNSSVDKPSGESNLDGARFWHQARKDGGKTTVGVWSGQWTYRADKAPYTEELPYAKVIVTPDANGDGAVDWQDGAVAFREIGVKPPGWQGTKDRVVAHIPFNFASQATNPFLRTLDNVKRIALATDGLGQQALLKGYGSEGHDSAHPDYGGNHNKRAGGLKDLNTLLKKGKKWNATFGVHVQNTESYPEAKSFSEKLVDKTKPGWNWLDPSYYIDQRTDLASGEFAKRLKRLRQETDPNLSFLYVDVFYSSGWLSDRHQKDIAALGWNVNTEWAYSMERTSTWAHWANDLNYGGKDNKGLNSQIIRFIRNHEKDVWNGHPVLGQTALVDFEGWTGQNDWNAFYRNIWEKALPAKYLQGFQIRDWNDKDIAFTGGVRGTSANGKREIFAGDAKVIDGDTYLIPWTGGKLYHYNPKGGTTTWTVPAEYKGASRLNVFKLTDNGRVKAGDVRVKDGKVTVKADAGQPYILTPGSAKSPDANWGEDTQIKDPGFNASDLKAWNPSGPVQRWRLDKGQQVAVLAGGAGSSIRQRLNGLREGTYTATAFIEVEPGKSREVTLSAGDRATTIQRSTAKNGVGADEKRDTYYQRVSTTFTVKKGHGVDLTIKAGPGDAKVGVDDVRVTPGGSGGGDFEDDQAGWGPFVKGDAGGATDPRTHRSEKNAPYTQRGWNGKLVDDVIEGDWSLKAHEENSGLVYRTVPQTVRFEPGRKYRVEFDYQNAKAGAYQWVTGFDSVADAKPVSVETRRTDLGEQHTTRRFAEEVVGGCGDSWVGLRKSGGGIKEADFVLDGFKVTDLGPAAAPSCGSLSIAAPPGALEPGAGTKVTTAFTNHEREAATNVKVALAVPEGWTAAASTPAEFATVAPGARVSTTWTITPPADAKYDTYKIAATASYDGGRSAGDAIAVRTVPPAPKGQAWASDHPWTLAENGWGPVERDQSNGEQGSGDGGPISIGGKKHDKGLGAHADSTVRYYLGGTCTAFTAEVGVDDRQGTRGTVAFTVTADGRKVAESPLMKGGQPGHALTADVTGARYVDLNVTDGGDGDGNDWADWGSARFTCS
ncbi:endo-alpha-N-acetylgalactosaminidase family protein [Spirillospora sp. CA-294931]|uniref:endo-alpha-N-acetylgalactosaminidase family protein n=1 Tax=Spirillospora sp. CA-294931 TaxID=3240042 RepID=UPI003D903EE6